jgi:hypothetical protein
MPKMYETQDGKTVDVLAYERPSGQTVMDVEVVDSEGEVVEYITNLSYTGLTLLAVNRRWVPA